MGCFDTVKKNLESRGFSVRTFATAAEAAAYLDSAIDGTTVGIGGSMTVQQMGLYEKLSAHNEVHW
ncbi:MAG: LUD domain-containing protein, partial [Akkermansia sp.]